MNGKDQTVEEKPSLVPPVLAALLSLIVPGLGHMLARQFRKGLVLLLVFAALLIFVENKQMVNWACMIVIAREFAVTGLRLVAMEDGTVIAAGTSGKVKTALSMVCICIMLLPIHDFALISRITVDDICVALIVLVTVYSGIDYFVANKTAFNIKD